MCNPPLKLGAKYTWKKGDTMALIAARYRRGSQYAELIDHNKDLLSRNRYIMKEGDVIEIPPSWFPLPTLEFGTKFKGSFGMRVR